MSPANDVARVPNYTPIRDWLPANQGVYARFRRWLREGGYSHATITIYGVAARLTLGLLNKPYWLIELDSDLAHIQQLIETYYDCKATRDGYGKGLRKLAQFLNERQGRHPPAKQINWATYLASLPTWLADAVQGYVRHRQRAWLPEVKTERSSTLLSPLTLFLRWCCQRQELPDATAVTPTLWFTYLDERLASGRQAATVNKELAELHAFLRYLSTLPMPICERMLEVEPLPRPAHQPKDVPLEQLRLLWLEIEQVAQAEHRGVHRSGIMDKAWFLLMLHSGLRTGEVRRLQRADVDLGRQRLWISQSKGLKDRIVYLSQPTVEALEAYLPWRGSLSSDHLFVYRHRPLTISYCKERLLTYGARCGVRVTPHQLRHSCATLLLNAGAPILTVQALLGHQRLDTTLTYARLYDSTVAADYYRAMVDVEQALPLTEVSAQATLTARQLVTIVDALRDGTLNKRQQSLLHTLRLGLLALVNEQEKDSLACPPVDSG